MPLRLQAVDPQNPQIVALMCGPLALFAVGDLPAEFSTAALLGASQVSNAWSVDTGSGKTAFRPFAGIGDETYRLYHKVNT
jgi:hypothetical protein